MKCEVYRNLHKDKWSLRSGGKVIDHRDCVILHNCKFVVGPKGRDRVLRTKHKNVHAFVRGYLDEVDGNFFFGDLVRVTYNPYRFDSFVVWETMEPVTGARWVVMDSDQRVYGIGLE